MCIYLRCRKCAVSEQFFHAVELRSAIEHRRGECVSEHVRAPTLRPSHSVEAAMHHTLHKHRVEGLAVGAREKRPLGRRCPGALTHFAISCYPLAKLTGKGYHPLLVALSEHLQLIYAHIGIEQPYKLIITISLSRTAVKSVQSTSSSRSTLRFSSRTVCGRRLRTFAISTSAAGFSTALP